MKPIIVEIVCCSVEDALATEAGGADRIELCVALSSGGLTPSLGLLLEVKARTSLPVMAMVRPRAGGFVYSEAELAVMERDAELLAAHGADGIVFGILTEAGNIDTDACRRIAGKAPGRQLVFHRAFDSTPDPLVALETLIGLGFTRALTSGQRKTALDGTETLRQLQEKAAERIEILPGGGIRAHNVREVLERSGCRQVHLAPMVPQSVPTEGQNKEVDFGGYDRIDSETISIVCSAIREL
jgi:copper homeostasis protein